VEAGTWSKPVEGTYWENLERFDPPADTGNSKKAEKPVSRPLASPDLRVLSPKPIRKALWVKGRGFAPKQVVSPD